MLEDLAVEIEEGAVAAEFLQAGVGRGSVAFKFLADFAPKRAVENPNCADFDATLADHVTRLPGNARFS